MPGQSISLTAQQARKAVLLSQRIHPNPKLGCSTDATLLAIESLGYVQIDTISVVERAHHHTLWNRNYGYRAEHLDDLLENRTIFEYWSHAAAYLPMRDFRFSLPRKHALKTGSEPHWRDRDPKLMSKVLERIEAEGPLSSRDFNSASSAAAGVATTNRSSNKGESALANDGASGWWDWKPVKIALEQLFMQGDLMVCRRDGFRKVYDLTERVLPDDVDSSMPTNAEFEDHLIDVYLNANALGTAAQMAYLRKGLVNRIAKRCQEKFEAGELLKVDIKTMNSKTQQYYAKPDISEVLCNRLNQRTVKILSPFDNVLIQRKRTHYLFSFEYLIECYVPKAKRQYGYFCLPLLWGQNFAGRMDAKIDRKTGVLHILSLHLETKKRDEFMHSLTEPLEKFLKFNQGQKIQLDF